MFDFFLLVVVFDFSPSDRVTELAPAFSLSVFLMKAKGAIFQAEGRNGRNFCRSTHWANSGMGLLVYRLFYDFLLFIPRRIRRTHRSFIFSLILFLSLLNTCARTTCVQDSGLRKTRPSATFEFTQLYLAALGYV